MMPSVQRRFHRRIPPIVSLILVCVFLVVSGGTSQASVLDRIRDAFRRWELFQGVEATGSNRLTFQHNLIDGSKTAYENQRWDTGSLVRQTSLHVGGPIWKEFAFQADLSYSGYGASFSRWIAGYSGHDTSLFYGDLNVNISGSEFVSFSKPLKGWQLDQALPKNGLLRAFYSQEKGLTRNQTLSGNNTSGPYFLTYTPIIDGSELVKVNEEVQRFGRDYTLDYQSGQLLFEAPGKPPKIIPDTSLISVSYQSYGYGASPSTLSGFRAEMPLMDNRLLVGVTHVRQDQDTPTADSVGFQEDIYQGSGSTGPFDTIFRPIIANGTRAVYKGESRVIEQALVVLVDNVEQVEGIDYDSYRQIGRVIFRRAVPPTALVLIRYYYDLTTNYSTGNQAVTGIDLSYRISDFLMLQADYGRSSDEGEGSGGASQVNLSYDRPRLNALLSWRNIEPDFSYLNSVGFYRQEKGTDVAVRWQPHDHIRLHTRVSDMTSSSGYSFGYSPYSGGIGFGDSYGGYGSYGGYSSYGSTYPYAVESSQIAQLGDGLNVNTDRREFDLELDFPRWPRVQLSRQEMGNTGGSSGTSDMITDQIRLNYTPAKSSWSVSSGFERNKQDYLGSGDDAERRGSSTERFDLSGRYDIGSRLSLAASMSNNKSLSAYDGDRSSSDSMQVGLRWSPMRNLDLDLQHRLSEATGRVSFYGGYQSYQPGYGGIGGGGGGYIPPGREENDDEDPGTSKYQDANSSLRVSYRPTDTLNLDLMLTQRKYSSGGGIGYLADSNQNTWNVAANYRLSDDWGLNLMYGTDSLDFLQEGRGAVSNRMLSLGVNHQPRDKPYSGGLSFNLQSGSSPTYVGFGEAQKMFMVDNDLFDIQSYGNYRLDDKSSVGLRLGVSDFVGGYADFKKYNVDLEYQRKLSNLATLAFGYRYIRNTSRLPVDPRFGYSSLTPPSQNYAANTFMLTLNTNFHSGTGGAPRQLYTGYAGSTGYGLGSFGGYRIGGDYGTYQDYSQSGMVPGSYGAGYGAFESLRQGPISEYDQRVPGFGIFEGSGSYQAPSDYRPPDAGLEAGLGEFQADDIRRQMGRSGQDGVSDDRPQPEDAEVDRPKVDGPPDTGLPYWLTPEDWWRLWPYYLTDTGF